MNWTSLAYRKTAAEDGSGLGVLIALFDTLTGNLRRAADAQRNKRIEDRCREVDHALRILAHLDNLLPEGSDGELTVRLRGFYAGLRHILLEAQIKQSAEMLEAQVSEVLKVRAIWQQVDLAAPAPSPQPASNSLPGFVPAFGGIGSRTENSWSA